MNEHARYWPSERPVGLGDLKIQAITIRTELNEQVIVIRTQLSSRPL